MPNGKSNSQSGHAYVDTVLECLKTDPQRVNEWQNGSHGTKVCLKAKNQHAIERAYKEAQQLGIPCALIVDSGHIMPPYFDGSPIVTALGMGPARQDEINQITKRFNLL